MKYLLGTSFFFKPNNGLEMCNAWHANNRLLDIQPDRVVAIYEGNSPVFNRPGVEEISLSGDLGHIEDHVNGKKPFHLTGWSASVCALAMLAYLNESDLIFKESDCIIKGPIVARAYQELGEGGLIFGRKMNSAPWMSCAQSFFLVRHHFIPAFVSVYLSLTSDRQLLGEDKFCQVEAHYPSLCKRFSFGVDRERPIPWNDFVWYAQQLSQAEMAEAKKQGLI